MTLDTVSELETSPHVNVETVDRFQVLTGLEHALIGSSIAYKNTVVNEGTILKDLIRTDPDFVLTPYGLTTEHADPHEIWKAREHTRIPDVYSLFSEESMFDLLQSKRHPVLILKQPEDANTEEVRSFAIAFEDKDGNQIPVPIDTSSNEFLDELYKDVLVYNTEDLDSSQVQFRVKLPGEKVKYKEAA